MVVPYGSIARHNRAEVWVCCQCESRDKGVHLPIYLLVQACQQLWLVDFDDVYQQFTYVSHVILTLLLSACCWQIQLLLTDQRTVSCGYVYQ